MIKLLRQFLADSKELLYTPPSDKNVRGMAMIVTVFAILEVSIGIPFTGDSSYYVVLIIGTLFLIYRGGFKISASFIALYFIIILNILVVDIPPFFKPLQRALLFILLTLTCTSAMETSVAAKFRAYLFRYIAFGMIILSVGSFFCFFLGINLMIPEKIAEAYGGYQTRGGWFGGLTTHSMMLGPISMISALVFYFLYQKGSSKLYLLLFFLSAMSAVFAASRSALLGLVVAIVYNLLFGKVNSKMRKRMISILAISAILTIPIAGIAFKGLINKQESRNAQSSSLNTRQGKFDSRIEEFKSSPIFGIGFCAVDPDSGDCEPSEGRIEPGTSHLSVLSMTGLAGFVVYLIILYKAYHNTKVIKNLHSRFVFVCFIAFFVHAWFEGYIFAAGGFLALVYWLVIGQCIDCDKISKIMSSQAIKQQNNKYLR